MKLIYVAGPYRGRSPSDILANIRRAEATAMSVWRTGNAALCPHLNSAFFDGITSDADFIAGTLMMLEKCDGLVLVDGWERSEGTKGEIEFANALAIPVFPNVEALYDYEWEPKYVSSCTPAYWCEECKMSYDGSALCPVHKTPLAPF